MVSSPDRTDRKRQKVGHHATADGFGAAAHGAAALPRRSDGPLPAGAAREPPVLPRFFPPRPGHRPLFVPWIGPDRLVPESGGPRGVRDPMGGGIDARRPDPHLRRVPRGAA